MKMCVIGIESIPAGKRNLKDPRLDQADRLVEAKKKVYAQADIVGLEAAQEADVILVHADHYHDLILKDLELVETRLTRTESAEERDALNKLRAALEAERTVGTAGLGPAETQAISAHSFLTNRPVVVGAAAEMADPDALVLRAFRESGHLCFLTVGGKENRAWIIRPGTTAVDAAGSIHSDMQKGFIRAEIISFEEFLEAGGETEAKRAGKQRLETKQYVMQDYDLVSFRFNK